MKNNGSASLENMSLADFTHEVCCPSAGCGGGTAVLAGAAFGAGLAAMAVRVTLRRSPEKAEKMQSRADLFEEAAARLLKLAEKDGSSYDGVLQARRLPKETPEEQQIRHEAVQKALLTSVEVPLTAAEECVNLLRGAADCSTDCVKACHTDLASGANLLYCGVLGCVYNIMQNAAGLDDSEPVKARARVMANQAGIIRSAVIRQTGTSLSD